MNVPSFARTLGAAMVGLVASLVQASPTPLSARDAAAAIAFDARIGTPLPRGAAFADESGRHAALGAWLDPTHPAIVVFTWFGCSTLCPTTIGMLATTLTASGLVAGRDVDVLAVSIDPADTPAVATRRRAAYASASADPAALDHWHFLTGSPVSIAALTAAAGYRAQYDPASHQFAHAGGFLLVDPAGRIAGSVGGFDYRPADLRRAVVAAGTREVASVGSALVDALLVCFHASPPGRYDASVMRTLQWIGLLLAAALSVAVWKAR